MLLFPAENPGVQWRRGHGLQLPGGRMVCGLTSTWGQCSSPDGYILFSMTYPDMPSGPLYELELSNGWSKSLNTAFFFFGFS